MSMFIGIKVAVVLFFAILAICAYVTASVAASRAFLGAVLFVLIGPPIGGLTFFVSSELTGQAHIGVLGYLLISIPIVIGTYIVGALPAAFVGAVVGLLSVRSTVLPCCLLAALLSIGISALLGGKAWNGELNMVLAMPSVVASIVSTFVFFWHDCSRKPNSI